MSSDSTPCRFNDDYVLVKYKENDRNKVVTYSKFIEHYPQVVGRPAFTKEIQPVCENVECLIKHYEVELSYNLIKHKIEVTIEEKTCTLADSLIYLWDCCEKHGFKIKKDRLKMQLVYIAHENKVNPVKEYILKSYYKNKGNNLKDMYETNRLIYTLVPAENEHSIKKMKLYITKWLIQAVALATCDEEDSVITQFILVLKGNQGIGKTSWFRSIVPKEMQAKYFMSGRNLDPNNKDHIIEMNGVWFCELGEVGSTTGKANNEQLKALITNDYDTVRLPYAEESTTLKRRTSLCATTNDERFLKDTTGSRRFVTIDISNTKKNANIDLSLVYAEIYNAYLSGAIFHFTDKEREELEKDNSNYKVKSDVQLGVETFFELLTDPKESMHGYVVRTSKQIHNVIVNHSSFADKPPTTVAIGRTLTAIGVVSKDLGKNRKGFYVKLINEEVDDC